MLGCVRGLGLAVGMLCAGGAAARPNLVLVILDDVGVDRIGAYGFVTAGPTPTIDALAAQGVRFASFWAQPTCSPFRASVLTGLTPSEHGIGAPIELGDPEKSRGLDPGIDTLPRRLRAAGYRTELVGKWHLAGEPDYTPQHPLLAGFDHHRGTLFNPGYLGGDYTNYEKCIDGACTMRTDAPYLTTDTTDDAIAALAGSEPFFLWIGYNAAHGPRHAPPPSLHGYGALDCSDPAQQASCHKAMVQALDTELARLLAAVDASDTTVVVVADNGTPAAAIEFPFQTEHGKRTVYEAGVNTPLIVAGAGVAPQARGRVATAIVQASDLFATLLELAGLPGESPSSVSFAAQLADPDAPPRRAWAVTESFVPNGGPPDPALRYDRAVRNARFKLIELTFRGVTSAEMYDLVGPPRDVFEYTDLLLWPALPPDAASLLPDLVDALAQGGAVATPVPALAAPLARAAAALAALGLGVRLLRRRDR